MKTDLFIEKMEQKYCWNCKKFKTAIKGSNKRKFEITCQENLRLKSMMHHPSIVLNYIDRKAMTCSNFTREFETGGK